MADEAISIFRRFKEKIAEKSGAHFVCVCSAPPVVRKEDS